MIVAHAVTEATVDDATTGIGLIRALNADIACVMADAAYDTIAFIRYGWRAWRYRHGPTEQDRACLSTATTVERSGSHH